MVNGTPPADGSDERNGATVVVSPVPSLRTAFEFVALNRSTCAWTVVFQMRNIPEVAATAEGTMFTELLLDWGLARFPLMVEVLPRGGELQIRFEFSRELFDHEHVARLGRQYLGMLELTADAVRD